jgi:WD40 repeat protein
LPGGESIEAIEHPGTISVVAFSEGSGELASGSADGVLRITREHADSFELTNLSAEVRSLGYVADNRLVVADGNRELHLYDTRGHQRLETIVTSELVSTLRWSSDGRRLVTIAPNDSKSPPALYDLNRFQLIALLQNGPAAVFSARFVRGDSEILTSSNDGIARLWSAATGRLRQTFAGSSQYIMDAAIDPPGQLLVTAGGDGVLRFWDMESSRLIWTLQAHHSTISGVRFSGEDLVTQTLTGEVARWRLPKIPAAEFASTVERVARCLPLRLDDATGRLTEQEPACDR